MLQQPQTSRSWRIVTCRIAQWTWIVTSWVWTSVIIVFLAQYVPNLLVLKNPGDALAGTWTTISLTWLRTPNHVLSLEILRWIALGVAFLLVALPPLAFFLKQLLQNAQPREGIDKLADVQQESVTKLIQALQEDPIWPHLEILLTQQFQQLFQKQDACIKALEDLSALLQQTFAGLQGLHTLSQQQQQSLQKDFTDTLQGLQDIQTKTSEQVQHLGKISPLLEELREPLKTLSLPDHRESRSWSNGQTITEPVPTVASTPQTDQLGQEASEDTTHSNNTSMSA